MQLKIGISKRLKVATCSLLAASTVNASDGTKVDVQEAPKKSFLQKLYDDASEKLKHWEFDLGLLFYKEPERVQAIEPAILAKRDYGDEKYLSLKFVLDTLTGASHNGASPAANVQTFTTPSGASSYTASPNTAPLDATFKDTRLAFSAGWEQPLSRLWQTSFGIQGSTEHDYLSLGANASLARHFNQKNTTVSFGLSASQDTITPEGGVPIPRASMGSPGGTQPRGASNDNKKVLDAIIGISQVMGKNTLMQWNYSYSTASGYLTDPYKLVSIIQATAGPTLGNTTDYIYENRPDSRTKHSLFWLTKHHLHKNTIDFSYRYMWDDWDITSHTADFRFRWNFAQQRKFIEPHLRYYTQTQADFYKTSLLNSSVVPTNLSADYRLGDLDTYTVGIKYGEVLQNKNTWSIRLEYYIQSGKAHPDGGVIGSQAGLDLYPTVDAFIAQMLYHF